MLCDVGIDHGSNPGSIPVHLTNQMLQNMHTLQKIVQCFETLPTFQNLEYEIAFPSKVFIPKLDKHGQRTFIAPLMNQPGSILMSRSVWFHILEQSHLNFFFLPSSSLSE